MDSIKMTTETQLPQGWEIKRLGDVATSEKGKKPKNQSNEKTDEFFKDINLLKENGLKVPESIEILYHLYDKYGIKKTAPVKLDEIMAEIKFLLQKHERN